MGLHVKLAAVPVQFSSDVGVLPIQEKKVVYPILEVAVVYLINKPVIAIVELILRPGKEDLAIGLAQRALVISPWTNYDEDGFWLASVRRLVLRHRTVCRTKTLGKRNENV
jgi:hypothetical protein